jgi:hypothetical protein
MSIDDTVGALRKHGLVLLVACGIVGPAAWVGSGYYYSERIEVLRARNELQLEQIRILEAKLQLPPPPTETLGAGRVEETSRLPAIEKPSSPTKQEVRQLARFYGLFNRWKTNPHLAYREGDISYWYEQGLTADELKREFTARRTVLDRAERNKRRIPTQGDLSYEAERYQASMGGAAGR